MIAETLHPKSLELEVQDLRSKLHLEQLKVATMLNLTQSFNLNFSSNAILEIYRSAISEELRIPDFLLYLTDEQNQFYVATQSQYHETTQIYEQSAAELLQDYTKTTPLAAEHKLVFKRFNTVIPVLHKNQLLGCLLVGKLPWAQDALIGDMLVYLQSITNIVVMGNENKKLFKTKLTQETLEKELKVARAVQDLLVPKELPDTNYFKASAIYMPNSAVGGDYFDCQQLNEHEWIFCIADVVGKGVPAALFMANVQANMRLLIDNHISLKNLVEQLAEKVYKNTQGEKYVTMFLGKINTQSGVLEYVNAGHVQPFICKSNGEIERLVCGTIPLGIEAKLPFLNIGKTQLATGSLFLGFTDGVSEIMDFRGNMYDTEVLEQFVKQYYSLEPRPFNEALLGSMKKFSAQNEFQDDVTVLTLRRGAV